MTDFAIHGSKGGASKPHTPVETPNNLLSVAYAKVLLAVAEGELAGNPTSKDIYLDGTPLQNEDGTMNFGGVKWEWRSGSQDQTAIEEFPEVSTEYSIGVELKDNVQWTRAITKPQLTDLRVTFQWPALLKTEDNGDTVGYSMDYAIDISTNGGAFVEYSKYNINGKTNTTYERTHKVKLPKPGTTWTIRARRITADDTTSKVQDTINVKSYAEVVAVKQRYPNTALLYVEFDSRLFGGGAIPKVSVKTKGRVIQVPSNYDPETRNYSGIWAGDFKWAWTDNPAWVYYDIVTQNRFGLGHKVNASMVDKWAIYEIAQYCDVLVDKGDNSGEKEPRHTCNIFIQEKKGAWQVLRDIASICNAMTYWDGNKFVMVADKEENISNIPVFSRSNVIGGRFDYQAADDKSIYTSALVSYDDPDNHYNTEVEATFETSQIMRWGGDRQVELSAIGCTSRGEAQRRGKYMLITNMYNRTVSFQTGLQGMSDDVKPGKIIHVTDPLIGGKPFTGRIKAAVGTVITLDRDVTAKSGDILYMTKGNGLTEGRTIASATGNVVTLNTAYTVTPPANAVWYLETADLKSQLFRVTKVSSPSEAVFEIEGVEYNESKFAAVDTGARLEPRPISVVPSGAVKAPTNVKVSSFTYTEQTMAVSSMVIEWDQMPNATQYEVQWKVDSGDWVIGGVTGAPTMTIKGIYSGSYIARVRAVNALGIKSVWANSELTELFGKAGLPPSLTSLVADPMVYGIRLDWTFPAGAEDTQRTEIMYSPTSSFAQAIKLGDFSYPTDSHEMHGLKAGQQFWFWGRLVDRTGNIGPYYPLETGLGIYGVSSTDQTEYEEYFKEQIGESALYKELNDRIDLIDGPPTLPGSVNERVKEVSDQVTEINQDVTDLTNSVNQSVTEINQAIAGINTDVTELQTQLDTDVANLNQSIGNVNTTLTNQINSVQQDLQTQIDAIDMSNTLPYDPTMTYTKDQVVQGSDRKLYQAKQNVPINKAPPNTTYWLDIGSAVITADGLAARVTKTEQDVTNLDGRVTANSTSITGLQSQINGKADASAVQSLTTRVTTAEGKIETNAQAITGLTTTVNGKADASAVNALTTRVTTAEGKIDANTTAITNLTTTVNGKADASAVSSLATRVTTAEGKIDANTTAITNLTTTVNGKADASALNALTTRVTTAEGKIDSNAQAITNLTTTVNGKADASAVTALTTRVTAVEGTVTSQGQSITSLTSTLGNISGNGSNLLESGYSWLTSTTLPTMGSALVTLSGVAVPESDSGFGYQMVTTNNSLFSYMVLAPANTTASYNLSLEAGTYLVSMWIKGNVAGQAQANLYDGTTSRVANISYTTTRTRYVFPIVLPAAAKCGLLVYPNRQGSSSPVTVTVDSVMVEKKLGNGEAASPFVAGPNAKEVRANATAISSLTTRVTNAEGTITSQGQAITSLTATVNNKADASALNALTTRVTTAEGTISSQGTAITNLTNTVAGKADASALNALTTRVTAAEGNITSQGQSLTQLTSVVGQQPDNLILKGTFEDGTIGPWTADPTISNVTHPAYSKAITFMANSFCGTTRNVVTSPGEMFDCSADVYNNDMTAGQTTRLQIQFYDKSNASIGYYTAFTVNAGTNGWQSMSGRITAPDGSVSCRFVIRHETTTSTGKSHWVNIVSRRVTAAENATATATSALTTRVTAAEGSITSQGQSITSLSNTVNNIGGNGSNLNPSEYSVFGPNPPSIGAISTGLTYSVVADASALGGYALKFAIANTTTTLACYLHASNVVGAVGSFPISYDNTKYILSFYAKSNVAGHQIRSFTRYVTSTATIGSTPSALHTLTANWVRYSMVIDMTNATTYSGNQMAVAFQPNISGVAGREVLLDRIMIEKQIGVSTDPSPFEGGSSYTASQANASATQALTTRVTAAEGTITSQGQAITSLTNTVAGKADAAALTALTTRVTAAEGNITSQGSSITSLNNSVNLIGGSGSNLLPSQYSWLTSTTLPAMAISTGATMTGIAVPGSLSGFGVSYTSTNTLNNYVMLAPTNNSAGWNINLEPGDYIVSYYASSPTSGAAVSVNLYGGGAGSYTASQALTTTRTRYSHIVTIATAMTAGYTLYPNRSGVTGTNVIFDSFMVEKRLAGNSTTASPFVAGPTAAEVAGKADASALTALTTRVTSVEGTVTAQGSSITNLTASLGTVATDNFVNDPTFSAGHGSNISTCVVLDRTDTSVPVGSPSARVVKWPTATSTGNLYLAFAVTQNARSPESALVYNMAVAGGDVYDFELYANSSVARQHGIWIQMYDATGASISHDWVAAGGDGVRLTNAVATWTKLTGTRTIPAGVVRMAMTFRASVGNASDIFISSPVIRKRSGQEVAQATATTALEARVTTAEGTITSQSSSITSLTNSLAGKADNSALTALTSRVTTVEGTVTAQGSALTQVQSTLGNIGGNGNNLLSDEYSWLTSATLPPTNGSGTGVAGVAVTGAVNGTGFGYKMTATGSSTGSYLMLCPANNVNNFNIPIEAGTYIVSFYASTPTTASVRMRLYSTTTSAYSVAQTVTSTRTRYSHVITIGAPSTMAVLFYYNMLGAAAQELTVDSVMVERQIGTNTTASPFVAGPSARAVSAQATAISQMDTKVTQIGNDVTVQATRIDGIYAQVNPDMAGNSGNQAGRTGKLVGVWTEQSARIEGDVATGQRIDNIQAQVGAQGDALGYASAAIEQVSFAQAGLEGQTKAMWAVKMEANAQGQYVAAGIGLGIENGPAGLQSQFLVSVDRFAVVNGVNGALTAPFVVSGGQVFIADALINKATITNAIIGSTITSSAQTNWGGPVMATDFANGLIVVRHPTMANTYTLIDRNGVQVVVSGVLRVRMGTW